MSIELLRRLGDAELTLATSTADRAPTSAAWSATWAKRWAAARTSPALRRLWVDPFRDPRMFTLEELQAAGAKRGEEALDALLLPIEAGAGRAGRRSRSTPRQATAPGPWAGGSAWRAGRRRSSPCNVVDQAGRSLGLADAGRRGRAARPGACSAGPISGISRAVAYRSRTRSYTLFRTAFAATITGLSTERSPNRRVSRCVVAIDDVPAGFASQEKNHVHRQQQDHRRIQARRQRHRFPGSPGRPALRPHRRT